MTNGSGTFPQHTNETKFPPYQPCYLALEHVFISCTMASWRRLLLIRAHIHQDFILTYCLRQTKMSPGPAATGTFVTNAAPCFRTERYYSIHSEAVPSDLDEQLLSPSSHSSLSPRFPAWIHRMALTQLENGLQLFHH